MSASDAVFIASSKGLPAGLVNCAIAMRKGHSLPASLTTMLTMAIGLLGYGVSLMFFDLPLRGLGAPRIPLGERPRISRRLVGLS